MDMKCKLCFKGEHRTCTSIASEESPAVIATAMQIAEVFFCLSLTVPLVRCLACCAAVTNSPAACCLQVPLAEASSKCMHQWMRDALNTWIANKGWQQQLEAAAAGAQHEQQQQQLQGSDSGSLSSSS
jgi:hypothetical protein